MKEHIVFFYFYWCPGEKLAIGLKLPLPLLFCSLPIVCLTFFFFRYVSFSCCLSKCNPDMAQVELVVKRRHIQWTRGAGE